MRTLIIGLLVLAGTASAQDSLYFKFNKHIIAAWGASKGAVMALAKDAGLEFIEIDNIPENNILHITYADKGIRGVVIHRMFSFFSGKYIGHSWIIMGDIVKRNKIVAKHQEYCLQQGEPSDEAHKFMVLQDGVQFNITAKNNKDSGLIMLVNMSEVGKLETR